MKYSKELVLKINELYHDLENDSYSLKHPEIFNDEAIRWQGIGRNYINNKSETVRIMDFGSGTGFVGMQINCFLKPEDEFYNVDISIEMLKICEKNLNNLKCKTYYEKFDGYKLNFEKEYFDIITINSVVHHIPDQENIYREINRLLKVNGLLIIGHEPNNLYFQNRKLFLRFKILSFFLNPPLFFNIFTKNQKLKNLLLKIFQLFNRNIKSHINLIRKLNNILISDKIIKNPLTPFEVSEIVDINSPSTGKLDISRGINPFSIRENYLKEFEILMLDTYNHLFKLRSGILKKYEKFLQESYPNDGSNFFLVLTKRNIH